MPRRSGAVLRRRIGVRAPSFENLARRSVAGIRCGAERLDRPAAGTAGGQPISGLRPPRTPAPLTHETTKPGQSRAPPTLLRRAERPRAGNGQRGQDRSPPLGRRGHGPTASGVGAVAAAAIRPPGRRQAAGGPGGGAFGRSKRLAAVSRGSPRVSPRRRRRDCTRPSRRNQVSPTSRTSDARRPLRRPSAETHPRTRAPAHPRTRAPAHQSASNREQERGGHE
jgi:hypothetical protein